MQIYAYFVTGMLVLLYCIQVTDAQTPTTIPAQSIDPTSGLKFIDQKAYVYTIPPLEVQQQQQATSSNSLDSILPALLGSVGAFISGKVLSDRKTGKVADTVQEVVLPEQVKQNEKTKELARVTYDMNPEKAAEIKDAPAVKIATLTEDASKFAETAAKTKLP